jgi:hypothetical protein
MSTRGVIARQNGTGFTGVYHHWGSYPEGLGKTLWELWHGDFKQDTGAMLKALIDEHPAGWSTICGKDFALPIGYRNLDDMPCAKCGKPSWEHYYQNWEHHGKRLTKEAKAEMAQYHYSALGHSFEFTEDYHPQCYCHGDRHEEPLTVTEKNASDIGCEYAYVFNGNGQMAILSSFHTNGHKMIGMFGCGDPDAKWRPIAIVELADDEPDWERIRKEQ